MSVIVRARTAPVHLPWLVIAGALVAGACGGGQKALAPEHRGQKRAEIQTLWAEIERMEHGGHVAGGDAAGDAATEVEADMAYDADEGTSAAEDIESMSVPTSTRAAGDTARPQARSATPRRRDMCHDRSRADQPTRCADVCRLAGSICDNATRICHLADELGGDAWAEERCEAASASCVRADARCCGCND